VDYCGSDGKSAGHTTDEGSQLQRGLEAAGFLLVGTGFGDGCRDVVELLRRHRPRAVFVQDVRDWAAESNISFRKDLDFEGIDNLATTSGVRSYTVLKDAWGWEPLQHGLAKKIKPRAIFCYYRLDMVREVAPWTHGYNLRRMYHSVDADFIRGLELWGDRRRALVSGNNAGCYPIRALAFKNAKQLGIETLKHPGYGNKGADTPNYLRTVAGYKVHIATASKWGAAFRKIIESVALGCTPITDLPRTDKLPEIDDALFRIPAGLDLASLRNRITEAERQWDRNETQRRVWSAKALQFYDFKAAGKRLAAEMED
jgi:hypothetical protein